MKNSGDGGPVGIPVLNEMESGCCCAGGIVGRGAEAILPLPRPIGISEIAALKYLTGCSFGEICAVGRSTAVAVGNGAGAGAAFFDQGQNEVVEPAWPDFLACIAIPAGSAFAFVAAKATAH